MEFVAYPQQNNKENIGRKRKTTICVAYVITVVVGLCNILIDSKSGKIQNISPLRTMGCASNPYQSSLDSPLYEVSSKLNSWLEDDYKKDLHEAISNKSLNRHTRERFKFFRDSFGQCLEKDCVGGKCAEDEAKVVCGLTELQEGCIVYSIGGNNQWLFELDALKKTPCQIHTFDCTGDESRFQKPSIDRLHFHHVCLGTKHEPKAKECVGGIKCGETWTLMEIQQNLGHKRIDLFKMDIEGFEWSIFDSWPTLNDPRSDQVLLPHQLLVEFHYWTQFAELRPPETGVAYDFKTPGSIVNMTARLARMGYAVVHKKDGRVKHCTELTIMRARCPSTGEYSLVEDSSVDRRIKPFDPSGKAEQNPQLHTGVESLIAPSLPSWFNEYSKWHEHQLSLVNESNWQDFRYLIHRCHHSQKQCGGTADRLKSFPVVLRLGAALRRIVLYHWDWPHPLQEFLTPTRLGINWTFPHWLAYELDVLHSQAGGVYHDYNLNTMESVHQAQLTNQTVIRITHAYGTDAGEAIYNKLRDEQQQSMSSSKMKGIIDQDFQHAYHLLWQRNFQLSPPVQRRLEEQLSVLSLTPGQYTGYHFRSRYLSDETSNEENIINGALCAVHLSNNMPILVASDSRKATNIAVQYLNQNTSGAKAVTRMGNGREPLHLDRGNNFFARSNRHGSSDASDYYDVFVDLYLLSMARCIACGRGYFGVWANLLSEDPTCFFRFFRNGKYFFPRDQCEI